MAARKGLGREASHVVMRRLRTGSLTHCGLYVDERAAPGAVVELPGRKRPLPRCQKCAAATT